MYRLATRLGLAGWVKNSTSGVHIEIEGTPEQCLRFMADLPGAIPFPGRIDDAKISDRTPLGEADFTIDTSLQEETVRDAYPS